MAHRRGAGSATPIFRPTHVLPELRDRHSVRARTGSGCGRLHDRAHARRGWCGGRVPRPSGGPRPPGCGEGVASWRRGRAGVAAVSSGGDDDRPFVRPPELGDRVYGRAVPGRSSVPRHRVPRPWVLSDIIAAEGPLPPATVARVGVAVADALIAAHELGSSTATSNRETCCWIDTAGSSSLSSGSRRCSAGSRRRPTSSCSRPSTWRPKPCAANPTARGATSTAWRPPWRRP